MLYSSRWTTISIALLVCLPAVTACSDSDDQSIDEDLLDVVWRVDTLSTPEEQIVPGPDTLMSLQFYPDNMIDAITLCNDCTGIYKINKHRLLEIEWRSCTEMACIDRRGILEGRFFKALNSVSFYEISERGLTLFGSDRLYVIRLNRE